MNGSGGGGAGGAIIGIIYLAILIGGIAAMWKVFTKAGQPGWAAIVPIYNLYVLTQIAGRPAWWIVLFFIPLVSLIATIILTVDVAKAFGKSTGFAIGMIFFVGWLILGFGDATYQGAPKSA
jgi:hypothetical protein